MEDQHILGNAFYMGVGCTMGCSISLSISKERRRIYQWKLKYKEVLRG